MLHGRTAELLDEMQHEVTHPTAHQFTPSWPHRRSNDLKSFHGDRFCGLGFQTPVRKSSGRRYARYSL